MENEDKQMAWFPAPYLENLDDEDEDDMDGTPERGTHIQFLSTPYYLNGRIVAVRTLQDHVLTSSLSQGCCTLQSRTTRPPKMTR